jgi:tetratricopeptide (TPR) repeat protein
MSTARTLHHEAMSVLQEAQLAAQRQENSLHKELLAKACDIESRAAYLLKDKIQAEPTRSVLFRSAATLALQCNEPRRAEQLVTDALAGEVPAEIREELLAVFAEAGKSTNLASSHEARQHYEKAIALNPNDASAHANLAVLLDEHFAAYPDARYHYEIALSLNSQDYSIYVNLAALLAEHFHQPIAARSFYEQALSLNPNNANAHYNLALLLIESFNFPNAAKKHYERALEINPLHDEAHNNLAILLEKNYKQYPEALFHYNCAIKTAPKNADAWYNLAVLLAEHYGQRVKAKECYRMSCLLDKSVRTPDTERFFNKLLDVKSNASKKIDSKIYNTQMHSVDNEN